MPEILESNVAFTPKCYHRGRITVLRTLASSALAVLLMSSLLWGGCLSCSQFLMLPTTSAQHCCTPTGQCHRVPAPSPISNDCTIQPIALGGIAPDTVLRASLPVADAPAPITAHMPVLHLSSGATVLAVATGSLPDLCLLHSVFRV